MYRNLEYAVFCSNKSKNVPLENSPGRQDHAEEIWKLNNHRREKRISAPLKVKVHGNDYPDVIVF